tara:strand:+ start:1203 stop:1553 length:351 start_codon:yes stop_codon:yes gene_type:complete
MVDLIGYYVVGSLIVCGLQTIWFCSNLPVHVFKIIGLVKESDDVHTWDDWQLWIVLKSNFFGELLTCTVCSSFWLSVITACIQHFYLDIGSIWYIVAAGLSWPAIAYLQYKLSNNE